MAQLKMLGYNSIDVYFPWNHHEQREGEWDFDGERDVSAFLGAAAEAGLWVIARPGPYICSEWDGGALPAYLLTKEDMKLRDNHPPFLSHVAAWFDRIMPILASFQEGGGGTVIAVQLDNELDFYNCADPKGYIGALRDMALARGITVPLFACAGQGGLEQATGWADGVAPACNVYSDDRAPELEAKVLHYQRSVRERGYPLLVTETNRSHYFLRRLLACGAKLLGPYLQVSGTDFGFTNATNNWGRPLAFLTSDYDFGGIISPEGHIREEAYEGRLLSRLIGTYGEALSEAEVPDAEQGAWLLEGDEAGVAKPQALRLKGGGHLIFVTNLEDREKRLAVLPPGGPGAALSRIACTLPGGRSVILPFGVPLARFGAEGVLESASAELYLAAPVASGVALAFHGGAGTEVTLQLEEPQQWDAVGASAMYRDGRLVMKAGGGEDASCRLQFSDGRVLLLMIHPLDKALHMERIDENGVLVTGSHASPPAPAVQAVREWGLSVFDAAGPIAPAAGPRRAARAEYLEREGIYRGYAWYEATVPTDHGRAVEGVLVRKGSDIVSVYADGHYAGTVIPGGSDAYLALKQPQPLQRLQARVEIWGHSNFDDVLLPSLGLQAMKGLRGLTAITKRHALGGNWSLDRTPYRGALTEPPAERDSSHWPLLAFGSWTSPDQPAQECYRRSFTASEGTDSWTLHFPGLQVQARLYADGHDLGEISPFDPYIELTGVLSPGQTIELTVVMERSRGLPTGDVWLYEGIAAEGWSISAAEEAQWLAHAASQMSRTTAVSLPLTLEPGAAAWLYGSAANSGQGKGWRVVVQGSAIKLTVCFAGRIVGRLWLPGASGGPALRGGDPASFYMPGAWYAAESGQLSILLEAIDTEMPGQLTSVQFSAV